MKTVTYIFFLLLSAILFTNSTFATVNMNTFPKANSFEAIQTNRLIGLQSDNKGLRISCAFFLGEMQSHDAVIPLMKMLREGKTSAERIVAALSLVKIGDARGVYLVKREITFSNDAPTRRFCERFYTGYLIMEYNKVNPDKGYDLSLESLLSGNFVASN